MPVTKINGIAIGEGRPGPVYGRLVEAWSRLVGLDIVGQITAGAQRRTTGTEAAWQWLRHSRSFRRKRSYGPATGPA